MAQLVNERLNLESEQQLKNQNSTVVRTAGRESVFTLV